MARIAKKKIEVGGVWPTYRSVPVKVMRIASHKDITVRFQDALSYTTSVSSSTLRSGHIKNPYQASVWGIGYMGVGEHTTTTSKLAYDRWKKMLETSVKGGKYSVCPAWLNFQKFAAWLYSQENYRDKNVLDKSVLNPNSREYNPESCTLLPRAVHSTVLVEDNMDILLNPDTERYELYFYVSGARRMFGSYLSRQQAQAFYPIEKKKLVCAAARHYKSRLTHEAYNALMRWELPE